MLGYIKERMEALSQECSAHRELATKRQQLVSSFEDHMDKVSKETTIVCKLGAIIYYYYM